MYGDAICLYGHSKFIDSENYNGNCLLITLLCKTQNEQKAIDLELEENSLMFKDEF